MGCRFTCHPPASHTDPQGEAERLATLCANHPSFQILSPWLHQIEEAWQGETLLPLPFPYRSKPSLFADSETPRLGETAFATLCFTILAHTNAKLFSVLINSFGWRECFLSPARQPPLFHRQAQRPWQHALNITPCLSQ